MLPLVTPGVRHQVELLQNDPDLNSLWRIQFNKEAQGTSYNESLHSSLRLLKPMKSTKTNYATLSMMVGIAMLKHNTRQCFGKNTGIFNIYYSIQYETKQNVLKANIASAFQELPIFQCSIVSIASFDEVDSSYENMMNLGFLSKQRSKDPWNAADVKILKKALLDLHNGVEKPQQKDLFYWLAHYKFHDRKTAKQIKWMVNQQIRQMEEKV